MEFVLPILASSSVFFLGLREVISLSQRERDGERENSLAELRWEAQPFTPSLGLSATSPHGLSPLTQVSVPAEALIHPPPTEV